MIHIQKEPRQTVSPLTRGVNIEELHHQLSGGLDSQMLAGESFFEPSHAEWMRAAGCAAGYVNTPGAIEIKGGTLVAGPEVRFTSERDDVSAVEARLSTEGRLGLALCVGKNNAVDRYLWYSGYTAMLDMANRRVTLTRAEKANRHEIVGEAVLNAKGSLALSESGGEITVRLGGSVAITYRDEHPIARGRAALVFESAGEMECLEVNGASTPLVSSKPEAHPSRDVSLCWTAYARDARGEWSLDSSLTLHEGVHCQRVIHLGGEGGVGLVNAGLEGKGLALQKGRLYEGIVWAKLDARCEARLLNRDGAQVYAKAELTPDGAVSGAYARYRFQLTPDETALDARFALMLLTPGAARFGYARLQPGAWGRYRDLWVRRDLAEKLLEQGTRLFRFNGGMIECDGYRWRTMQGEPDLRAPYDGFYDRYASRGYGPLEHVELCKRAGLVPIVGLNVEETPEDVRDFVRACRERLNAPLAYYQIANETAFDDQYVDAFKRAAEAIWQAEPDITLIPVGSAYRWPDDLPDEELVKKLKPQIELARFVTDAGKRLLFDAHSFCLSGDVMEPMRADANIRCAIRLIRLIRAQSPEFADLQLGLLELNSGRYDMLRALLHGVEMNVLHANSDVVSMAALPNAFQPLDVYQGDWKSVLWTQGNITYTNDDAWGQPAHFAQKMIAEHWIETALDVQCDEPNVSAFAGTDSEGRVILRVVNGTPTARRLELSIEGIGPGALILAKKVELSGPSRAINTRDCRHAIAPAASEEAIRANDAGLCEVAISGWGFAIWTFVGG